MNFIMHFQHGNRLSWNRDFFKLDDQTGDLTTVRLNLLQRIVRLTLGGLASTVGWDAFYAKTIITQKRIRSFEKTENSEVADKIDTLVRALNIFGKNISYRVPLLEHANQQTVTSAKDFAGTCYEDAVQALADESDPGIIFRGFKRVLESLVKYDIDATKRAVAIAKQKAEKLDEFYKDLLLVEIAKVEGRYDFIIAQETLGEIKENLYRVGALFYIVLYIHKDFQRAKALNLLGDSNLRDVVSVQAKSDLQGANETLALIKDSLWLNKAKIEIIKIIAKTDLLEARRLAAELVDPRYRYEAELAIAQVEPEHNFEQVIATALTINNGKDNEQEKALADIAITQSLFDKPGAQNTLALIRENSFYRKQAEYAIYERDEIKKDMNAAMQAVLTTPNDSNFHAQLLLIEHIARKNMKQAKMMAHSFQDVENRVIALDKLAQFALQRD